MSVFRFVAFPMIIFCAVSAYARRRRAVQLRRHLAQYPMHGAGIAMSSPPPYAGRGGGGGYPSAPAGFSAPAGLHYGGGGQTVLPAQGVPVSVTQAVPPGTVVGTAVPSPGAGAAGVAAAGGAPVVCAQAVPISAAAGQMVVAQATAVPAAPPP